MMWSVLTHFGSHLKRLLIQGPSQAQKQAKQQGSYSRWSSSQHPDLAKGIPATDLAEDIEQQ